MNQSCQWAGDTTGQYTIRVTVREEETTTPVFTDTLSFERGTPPVLQGVALAVAPTSPAPQKTRIVLSANVTGGAENTGTGYVKLKLSF